MGQVHSPLLFCVLWATSSPAYPWEHGPTWNPQGLFPCVFQHSGPQFRALSGCLSWYGVLRSCVFLGKKDRGKTMQTNYRFWQPRGPRVATFGVLAEGLPQGKGTFGFPSWRAVWSGCISKVRLLTRGSNFGCLLASLAPVHWSSRHSGALGSLSQGPQVSGENRSLEEQSPEPAQALNVISSSLNRIGTGAKGSSGPPSGSQLSRPGAHLDGLLASQAASPFLLVKPGMMVSGK